MYGGGLFSKKINSSYIGVVNIAVVKKSSSGKAIQFILSEDVPAGTVFQLSASLFGRVMSNGISGDFVVLSRMPIPVPGDKFPVSPVYGDVGLKSAVENSGSVDAFSKDFLLERKDQASAKKAQSYSVKW